MFCFYFIQMLKKRRFSRNCVSSAPGDVFGLVFPQESCVWGVEASLPSSEHGPAGRLGHVVQSPEGLGTAALVVLLDELMEALVVDPRPPIPIHLKL